MGNAFVDDTDVTTNFFFATNSKTYSCHSIVTSIYVFKQPSSSVGRDFADAILNVGGSDEGDGGGNDNNTAS
jgi:hypothetical protein